MNKLFLLITCIYNIAICQEGWSEPEIIATDSAMIGIRVAAMDTVTGEIYFIWWSWYIKEGAPYLVLHYIRQDTSSIWTFPVQLATQSVRHNIADPSIVFNHTSGTFSVFRGVSISDNPSEKFVTLTEYNKSTGQEIKQTTVFQVRDTTRNEEFLIYDLVKNSSGDLFSVTDYRDIFDESKNSLLFRSYITQTWSEVREISSWDSTGYEYEPSICIDNNDNLHVVFVGQSPEFSDPSDPFNYWRVYYIISSDYGKNWTDPKLVNEDSSWHARLPQILIDNNNIRHILWSEDVNGDLWTDAIYYTFSTDGINWEIPQNLSPGSDSFAWITPKKMTLDKNGQLHFQFVNRNLEGPNGESIIQYVYGREHSWNISDNPYTGYPRITNGAGIFVTGYDDRIHSIWPRFEKNDDLSLNRALLMHRWKKQNDLSIQSYRPLPDKFLLNIYPNPFNASTVIQFSIQKRYQVTLTIYDMLGRKIETMLKQNLERGNYTVQWGGSGLASGIYFITLAYEDNRKTRKVVLLR